MIQRLSDWDEVIAAFAGIRAATCFAVPLPVAQVLLANGHNDDGYLIHGALRDVAGRPRQEFMDLIMSGWVTSASRPPAGSRIVLFGNVGKADMTDTARDHSAR